jgi:hypothetical protein
MIKLKNYWQETSPSVKRLILWLKGIIGAVSVSAFIQGDPKFSFWFLIAGGVVDGLLQLLPPDTNADLKPGAKALLLVVCLSVVAATVTGCWSQRPVVEHNVIDTTTTTYKSQDVQYKGAKVMKGLNIDSLYHAALMSHDQHLEDSALNAQAIAKYKQDSLTAVKNGKAIPAAPVLKPDKPVTRYVTDPLTKAQLSYWIDQYGKLQVGCESKDQTMQVLVAQVNRLRSDTTKATVTVYKIPSWIWYVLLPSLLLNALAVLLWYIKKSTLNIL